MILNPGSEHFNFSNGAPVLDYTDYPAAASLVSSLSNNPAAILS